MPDKWTLTRFFIPLAIQAASQALSYPLVAMVASRGPGGPLNLAGLAQAITVMFFLGMIAISSVTTGMVYAKTREGYQRFREVNLLTATGVIAVQGILAIPVLSHLLFGRLIGLPPSIEQPASTAFVISIPLQFLFFMRLPYFVVMYLGKATRKGQPGNHRPHPPHRNAVFAFLHPGNGRSNLGCRLSYHSGCNGGSDFQDICNSLP